MASILVVGSSKNKGGNQVVVDALRTRGFRVEYVDKVRVPNLLKIMNFDVIYGLHFQTCSRYTMAAEMLGKKTIIHFVGSDAYRYAKENGIRKLVWRNVVHACDLVLYVAPHLMELVGRSGRVLPLPIRVDLFKKVKENRSPKRDILYYCPTRGDRGEGGEVTYRLDWVLNYAKKHPEETITIIGNPGHPADYKISMPNVEVIPSVPYSKMAEVYAQHRKLVRMTTQDGLPTMVSEALLSGLEVIFNGKRVTEVPPERDPKVFADRFEEELRRIL